MCVCVHVHTHRHTKGIDLFDNSIATFKKLTFILETESLEEQDGVISTEEALTGHQLSKVL